MLANRSDILLCTLPLVDANAVALDRTVGASPRVPALPHRGDVRDATHHRPGAARLLRAAGPGRRQGRHAHQLRLHRAGNIR